MAKSQVLTLAFAAEAVDAFERGEQRLLGGVLGRGVVADLQQSEPIQRRPVARDFLGDQKGRDCHQNNPVTPCHENGLSADK